MYYASDGPPPHYVSIKTGKRYPFKCDCDGSDRMRALKQLEADDTPAPEPEPTIEPPAPIVPRARDFGAAARMELYEMKLQQLRRQQ